MLHSQQEELLPQVQQEQVQETPTEQECSASVEIYPHRASSNYLVQQESSASCVVQNQGYSQDRDYYVGQNEGYLQNEPEFGRRDSAVGKHQKSNPEQYFSNEPYFLGRNQKDDQSHHDNLTYEPNKSNIIHIDSRALCHQESPPAKEVNAQKPQRYEVTLENFQPYVEHHEQKYISKAHIDRNYPSTEVREQRSHSKQQDDANAIYQSYYEFKPIQGNETRVSGSVESESRKDYANSSETSPVFKKPADREHRFEQRADNKSLFVDYKHTSNKQKQDDYEIENKAFVENQNIENQRFKDMKSRGSSGASRGKPSYFTSTFSFTPRQPSSDRSIRASCDGEPSSVSLQTFRSYIGHCFQDGSQRGASDTRSYQSSRSHQSSSPVFRQHEYAHGVPNREYNSTSPIFYHGKTEVDNNMSLYNRERYEGTREHQISSLVDRTCDSENNLTRDSLYDNGANLGSFQSSVNVFSDSSENPGFDSTCDNSASVSQESIINYPVDQLQYMEDNSNYQKTNSVYDNAASREDYLDSCGTIYDNVNNRDDYRERESPYDNAAGPYESFLYPPQDDLY